MYQAGSLGCNSRSTRAISSRKPRRRFFKRRIIGCPVYQSIKIGVFNAQLDQMPFR